VERKVLPLLITQFANQFAGFDPFPLVGRQLKTKLANLGQCGKDTGNVPHRPELD
jgi:hypothetical protein